MKKTMKLLALVLALTLTLALLPLPQLSAADLPDAPQDISGDAAAETALSAFEVQDAALTLTAGPVSPAVFTGKVPDGAEYSLFSETWSGVVDDKGTVKYYSSNAEYNAVYAQEGLLLESFEVGTTYRYHVTFLLADGAVLNTSSPYTLRINGKTASGFNASPIREDRAISFTHCGSYTIPKPQAVFKLNDMTQNLAAGPVSPEIFTGRAPAGAEYPLAYELWSYQPSPTDIAKYYSSSPELNAEFKKNGILLESFDAGKLYWYSAAFRLPDDSAAGTDAYEQILLFNNTDVMFHKLNLPENEIFSSNLFLCGNLFYCRPENPSVLFKINGATLTLEEGEVPVFTGTTPEGEDYSLKYEYWVSEDGKYHYSDELLNEDKKKYTPQFYFETAEAGKTYYYYAVFHWKKSNGPGYGVPIHVQLNGKTTALVTSGFNSQVYCIDTTTEIKKVTYCTVPEKTLIRDFAVEDLNLSLTDGQPVAFSGHAPADADYELTEIVWTRDDGATLSSDGNRSAGFTAAEAGRSYSLTLYFRIKGTSEMLPLQLNAADVQLRGGSTPASLFDPEKENITLTINGSRITPSEDFLYNSYANDTRAYLADVLVVTVPEKKGGAYVEPEYYPDYREEEPPASARDESDTAPKTADAPMLPALALAALCALSLTVSLKKRFCR